MGTVYQPLIVYLERQRPEVVVVTLALDEVAAILGRPLPASAFTAAWWRNTRSSGHAQPWLSVGWRVERVAMRIARPVVTFVRVAPCRLYGVA